MRSATTPGLQRRDATYYIELGSVGAGPSATSQETTPREACDIPFGVSAQAPPSPLLIGREAEAARLSRFLSEPGTGPGAFRRDDREMLTRRRRRSLETRRLQHSGLGMDVRQSRRPMIAPGLLAPVVAIPIRQQGADSLRPAADRFRPTRCTSPAAPMTAFASLEPCPQLLGVHEPGG